MWAQTWQLTFCCIFMNLRQCTDVMACFFEIRHWYESYKLTEILKIDTQSVSICTTDQHFITQKLFRLWGDNRCEVQWDLLTWRHNQMETFSVLLSLCEGNPPVSGGFPSQRPAMQSIDVSLICAWTNDWANNWDAGDLRHHLAHYDVTAMITASVFSTILLIDIA